MIRLLLLRHAQTTWNAEARWQGWADVELSALGRTHALLVGPELAEFGFAGLHASDLVRTTETASLLNESLNLDGPQLESALRERGVGEWSGLNHDEIEAQWPGAIQRFATQPDFTPAGGESRTELTVRTRPAIQRLAELSAQLGRPVLAVTHGGVIRNTARHIGQDCGHIPNLSGLWLTGPNAENLRQDGIFHPVNSEQNPPITSL
jgi:broad specificity phosphatase PhoE